MNKLNKSTIYECPGCGQGGLRLVAIATEPLLSAIACAECDRIWILPKKVDIKGNTIVEDALVALGLQPDWTSLVTVAAGIDFDLISEDYQRILLNRGLQLNVDDRPA